MSTKRKTQEQFVEEIYQLVQDEYSVLGEYRNNKTKIKIRHNSKICENRIYEIRPNDFLNGRRCAKCSGRQKKTTESFTAELKKEQGSKYTVLSEYKGYDSKMKLRHNVCGYEWETSPRVALGLKSCPQCAPIEAGRRYAKTIEQFKREVHDLGNNEYSVLGEYVNASTPIRLKHNTCGNIYDQRPSDFVQGGHRCPKCRKEKAAQQIRKSHTEFEREFYELVGDEYELMNTYFNSLTKIKVRHSTCGNEYEVAPTSFMTGRGCAPCAFKRRGIESRKTQGEFEYEVKTLTSGEYSVIGNYINTKTKVDIHHAACGKTYSVAPSNFLNGHRCPNCNLSRGETEIRYCLENRKIQYQSEFTFEDCRNERLLPFDFSLYDEQDNLILLIEYDGEHHFEPVNFGGISDEKALENHLSTQLHDSIKDKYCIDNNIPLLRIPYWDFDNIETILEKELQKYNLLQNNKALEVV